MSERGYCGINSLTFLRAYDPSTNRFDKSQVPEMDDPARIYVHTPVFEFQAGRYTLIHNHCTGRLASKYSLKHGGWPIVFVVDLGQISDKVSVEIKNGVARQSRRIIDPPLVDVSKIYLVANYVMNIGTLLREISMEKLLRIHQFSVSPAKKSLELRVVTTS